MNLELQWIKREVALFGDVSETKTKVNDWYIKRGWKEEEEVGTYKDV